jgi:hypothetical protein
VTGTMTKRGMRRNCLSECTPEVYCISCAALVKATRRVSGTQETRR